MTSFPAARFGIDRVGGPECFQPGVLTPEPRVGCGILAPPPVFTPTVFINNIPAANITAIGTTHLPCCCGPECACVEHCSTQFIPPLGVPSTVFIDGKPALRLKDIATCGHPVATGSLNVFFG